VDVVDVVDVAPTRQRPPHVVSEWIFAFEIIIVAGFSLSEPYTTQTPFTRKIAVITLSMTFDHLLGFMNSGDVLPIQ
jgi:hypothetical protein